MKIWVYIIAIVICLASCVEVADSGVYTDTGGPVANPGETTRVVAEKLQPKGLKKLPKAIAITNEQIVAYAKTFLGTPYLYGSDNPSEGLDCSGFITAVYTYFNIKVPRSSVDFTNLGREVPLPNAVPGNLILFTGTDSTKRVVGHMGIVVGHHADTLKFIHSTLGKANGVTISPLDRYYMGRFVKIIDIM